MMKIGWLGILKIPSKGYIHFLSNQENLAENKPLPDTCTYSKMAHVNLGHLIWPVG